MNKLLLSLTLLLVISGCGTSGQTSANSKQSNSNDCPDKPETKLDIKNVKSIVLNNQTTTESGIASKSKSTGYAFEAQKGQKLKYNTSADVCLWVYTPDSELISTNVLLKNGKYTIQISAPKGSTTFELAMNLDGAESATTASNNTSQSSSTQSSERPSPAQMVKDHYIAINNRRYQETWDNLSPDFQRLSGSANAYGDYAEWWNSVERINIGDVRTVEQSDNRAIVDADLQYVMKTGRTATDENNRIYLIWNDSSKKWLFNSKRKS
ncbi:hypothetical protein DSM106972_092860 [Dulcicalothrix desertica PCC 7102]|uniref:ARC6 IMS domain-containing protein n=1 Tax=Dulcicalothrix desertica PCC 7102 TaxID=232991 RepID=A0A3S1AL74_9CYAN|nr:hypothetical protein [Dulcicalothrix desertica]RUS94649.1 hypothetical protein DSM106972_092860 [Dulcicalothrix desertica PCC 7102]TWH62543.1 hypothetical protein CAL7102_00034 [Dulcicalothrix desertica PCC 7102]